ncbi:MAG: alpha/beta hydrolase [Pseudomonadota bacterium]
MSYLYNIATFILVTFFCTTLVIYLVQRRLIYIPDTTYLKPAQVGLANIKEITLKTPDNQSLVSWYVKARKGQPTLLYFHGNAGNILNRKERIALYQSHGFGVFILGYRGYGASSGKPTEQHLITDGGIAYEWLIEQGVRAKEVILYGESLGTGVAVQLASQKQVKAVILETPYASLVEIGARQYPFLPVNLLMKDRYESIKFITKINAPLLILHGQRDNLIPVQSAQKLFEAATNPKEMKLYQYGTHTDLYGHGAWQDILSYLEKP